MSRRLNPAQYSSTEMRTIEKLLLCRGKFILGRELKGMNDGRWSMVEPHASCELAVATIDAQHQP
jgi:hypothetical protein